MQNRHFTLFTMSFLHFTNKVYFRNLTLILLKYIITLYDEDKESRLMLNAIYLLEDKQ